MHPAACPRVVRRAALVAVATAIARAAAKATAAGHQAFKQCARRLSPFRAEALAEALRRPTPAAQPKKKAAAPMSSAWAAATFLAPKPGVPRHTRARPTAAL